MKLLAVWFNISIGSKIETGSGKTFKMKHNLSKSLMTSRLSSFRRIALAVLVACTCSSLVTTARADDATDIRDHNNRGNMLLARRLFQDAIKEYETVLQIDPSHSIAKGNLALAHNEWGIWFYRYKKYREAKEQWEIAIKINPNDQNVKRNLKLIENVPMPPVPEAAPAADAPPKPTGPQDWNPFDESLDKIPVKKSGSNAAVTPTPNVTVPAHTETASSAATGTGSGSPPNGSPSTTSATQAGGITSGATIISSSSANDSPFGTVDEASIAGSAKTAANSGATSGAVILSGGTSNSAGSQNGSAVVSPQSSATNLTADVPVADAPTNSIRIIGGDSGAASIIIGGSSAPSAAGTSPYGSTVSGGGGTANVFQSPGTPKPPVSTVASSTVTSGSAPIRFSPRPASGSVPMSWPGGEAGPSRGGDTGQTKSPGFLAKPNDNTESDKSDDDQKSEDSSSNAATVDDVLAKIETKVYGKVSKNMPILKRIERLEVETMGKKKSGSIADRLKELKETYGF